MKRRWVRLLLLAVAIFIPLKMILGHETTQLTLSHKSGFYNDPFYLTISAPSDRIYYTLDGTDPTLDSIPYRGPIYIDDATKQENVLSARDDLDSFGQNHPELIDTQIPEEKVDKCTILKAAWFDSLGNRKEVLCASYFVGYQDKIGYGSLKVVSLITEPVNLVDYNTGIFVRGRNYDELKDTFEDAIPGNYHERGREWERQAVFQYFDADGTPLYTSDCGIRIMGGWHRKTVLKSLNVVARKEYGGSSTFQYDFWGTGYQPHKFTLHSGSNDFYGKVQNLMISNLTRNLDYGTMHYEICVLFLNGEYWGIYNLTEKYDERFLANTYHVNKDNVFSAKKDEPEAGDSTNMELYTSAIEFLETSDMTKEENYQRFQKLFDEQSLLDLFGTEIYCARTADWPDGNIHMWRTVSTGGDGYADGRWRYLLYDLDSYGLTEDLVDHDTIQRAMDECAYFRSLCRNETFRKKLGANILRIGREYLNPERIAGVIGPYKALMADPMKVYFQRFFNADTTKIYRRLDSNQAFFNGRLEVMERLLAEHDMLP